MAETVIHNVSDTALWVAVYRAEESQRPDALFRDKLADRLVGERGRFIAAKMSRTRYTSWSVVMRTYIIDNFFRELLQNGVDTVVNLGAGLDTRPYRLDLPSELRWIEVDYPQIIRLKNEKLGGEKPNCRLERIEMDLGDDLSRRQFLSRVNAESKKVAVLTEGVTPYLTPEQVTALATDLRAQDHFSYWIIDYYSPAVVKYMKSRKRMKQMQNAPFRFFPQDWFGFFSALGWKAKKESYLAEESLRIGRPIPMPWWVKVLRLFFRSPEKDRMMARMTAYVLLEPQ